METQMGLFDSPAMDQAISRASDPETSRIAAELVADSLHGAKAAMFAAFRDGPKTANEAAAWCVQRDGKYMSETYRKRYLELKSACLIRPSTTERVCEITNYPAVVWEVVE